MPVLAAWLGLVCMAVRVMRSFMTPVVPMIEITTASHRQEQGNWRRAFKSHNRSMEASKLDRSTTLANSVIQGAREGWLAGGDHLITYLVWGMKCTMVKERRPIMRNG